MNADLTAQHPKASPAMLGVMERAGVSADMPMAQVIRLTSRQRQIEKARLDMDAALARVEAEGDSGPAARAFMQASLALLTATATTVQ